MSGIRGPIRPASGRLWSLRPFERGGLALRCGRRGPPVADPHCPQRRRILMPRRWSLLPSFPRGGGLTRAKRDTYSLQRRSARPDLRSPRRSSLLSGLRPAHLRGHRRQSPLRRGSATPRGRPRQNPGHAERTAGPDDGGERASQNPRRSHGSSDADARQEYAGDRVASVRHRRRLRSVYSRGRCWVATRERRLHLLDKAQAQGLVAGVADNDFSNLRFTTSSLRETAYRSTTPRGAKAGPPPDRRVGRVPIRPPHPQQGKTARPSLFPEW